MRRMTSMLCLLLSACGSAFAASDAPTGPATAAGDGFTSRVDCFADTPDHATWLRAVMRELPEGAPAERVAAVFSADVFERARRGFDCWRVTYMSDGHVVPGYIVQRKAGADVAPRPLIVYNRGGNRGFGRIGMLALVRDLMPLAKSGHVVVASQYRGSEEGPADRVGRDEFGGRDVRDVLRLLDLGRALPGVDARNVFMLGASRGAMMAFLAARQRADIRALATIAAPTDLHAGLAARPEMERVYAELIPDYARRPHAALAERSALLWAEQLPATLPVLLLHGEADDRVRVEDSRAMARRLEALARPHRLVVYAGDGHGLQAHRARAYAEILDWFASHAVR